VFHKNKNPGLGLGFFVGGALTTITSGFDSLTHIFICRGNDLH